jgi:alpha-ketoglutarate-dependent taurine dioxygenase
MPGAVQVEAAKLLSAVAAEGWVCVPGFCEPGQAEERLGALASSFGRVAPARASSRSKLETLRPLRRELAHPRSLSAKHGNDAFPFHTDAAHWPVPSRLALLLCQETGPNAAVTELVPVRRLMFTPEERRRLTGAVFLVQNGRGSFFSTAVGCNWTFLRFDEGCMRPVDSAAEAAADLITQRLREVEHTAITWRPGTLLVIDNWCVLHARASAHKPADERVLLRALVQVRGDEL